MNIRKIPRITSVSAGALFTIGTTIFAIFLYFWRGCVYYKVIITCILAWSWISLIIIIIHEHFRQKKEEKGRKKTKKEIRREKTNGKKQKLSSQRIINSIHIRPGTRQYYPNDRVMSWKIEIRNNNNIPLYFIDYDCSLIINDETIPSYKYYKGDFLKYIRLRFEISATDINPYDVGYCSGVHEIPLDVFNKNERGVLKGNINYKTEIGIITRPFELEIPLK